MIKQNIEIMSEKELYQDYERSIMIQDCNAFIKGLMVVPSYTNPLLLRGEVVLICLN